MQTEKSRCESILSMGLEPVACPHCGQTDAVRHGDSGESKQRYRCRHADCPRKTFMRNYACRGSLPEVKQQLSDMAMNGSGIRYSARVPGINPTMVIEPKKTSPSSESQYSTDIDAAP